MVMLDSDLAMLYQVETKVFNQAVKRNIERFPENYRFQLTKEADQMEWVCRMNSIRNRVDEIVLSEIVYSLSKMC
jgi:hypothetical protein